jgi:pimeloyl-ACP methyl ester carboxylesterase
MRILKWPLIGLLVALIGYTAVSLALAWYLTSPARKLVGDVPPELPAITKTVTFRARDGLALSGWFVPCVNSTKAVVLLHGNGSSRMQMLARARLFHDAGYATLLYDARGHGLSEGNKVSAGWFETSDLLGALDYLRTKNLNEFGCLGASQGGATILLTAEKLPPEVRWVIIESTYPTIRDALDRRFRMDVHLPGWFAGALFVPFAEIRLGVSVDQISPITHIQNLHCPVFVLGGTNDQHTLAVSTKALFAAAHEPKQLWLVPSAAHVDLYGFAQQEYAERILAFVTQAEAKP